MASSLACDLVGSYLSTTAGYHPRNHTKQHGQQKASCLFVWISGSFRRFKSGVGFEDS